MARETQSNTELFEPGAAPAPGGSVIAVFVVSLLMIFGGFYLMGLAFSLEDPWHWLFAPALLLSVLGFVVAFRDRGDR